MPGIPGRPPRSPASAAVPGPARNSSAFYLERELQGTRPGRIFEHDRNRTLALDHLCQAKHCQLPRRSACDAKHRFFSIPVLRSVRLFLCKNRFKILLAQEPPGSRQSCPLPSAPSKWVSNVLSVGIFWTGGAVSGSPNPSALSPHPHPRPGSGGLWGPQARWSGRDG